MSPPREKVLVAGWFSFELMGASAGDLMARDLICEWLELAGRPYDVALADPFPGGVEWSRVDPADYSDVVFVCGPFGNGPPVTEFIDRFAGRRLTGVDLTMLEPLDAWNPFDLLLERDSSRTARPDVSFLSRRALVPVAGLVLIDAQPEYGERDRRAVADRAIEALIASRELATVRIDTRLDVNRTGLRSAAEVESLIAKMDLVLTTRLHGMVLAIKNGVPAVAIDTVAGGGKVSRQAEAIGWRTLLGADELTPEALERALDWCLTEEARQEAQVCRDRSVKTLEGAREEFVAAMANGRAPSAH
jgi:Polysaccharide pyruvyl transferase